MATSNETHLKQLLLRGLDGDRAAYHGFLSGLADLLRGYVRRQLVRLGRRDSEAEDIVQEVLIAIHERRHTYEREVPVTAWAHAIARYKLIDFLRATPSTRHFLPLEEAAECVRDDAKQLEITFVVHRLLSALPDRFRRPIELTRLYGLSVAETAARIGVSEAAVKVNVHRGIKAMLRLAGGGR